MGTFVLGEGAGGRVDQGELEVLQRRFQIASDLENQAQSKVDLVGATVDRIDVEQLSERSRRPVEAEAKDAGQ